MVVFLHGALGSASQFEILAKEFTGDEVRVLEFPGHGSTPDVDGQLSTVNSQWSMVNSQWSIGLFSSYLEEQLVEIVTQTKSPVKIFGYSMGGYVALHLAMRRKELISHILTLGTKLGWSPDVAEREIKKLNADVIEQKVPAFAEDLKQRHGVERWRDVLAKTASMMVALGNNPIDDADMGRIDAKVRFCLGDRDEMVSFDETVAFYRETPGSELAILPQTRHPIEMVDHTRLLQQLTDFLLK